MMANLKNFILKEVITMKNSIKKRLLTMLLTLIVILPWTQIQSNTDPVSATNDITHEQDIICCSTPDTPDEKPTIITPD